MSTKKELDCFFRDFENGLLESESDKIYDLKSRTILLYGAGNVGQRVQQILSESGLDIVCYLDRNEKLALTASIIPIFHPESETVSKYKKEAHVIIAGLFDEHTRNSIKDYLQKLGYSYIYQLNEINFSQYTKEHYYENSIENQCRKLNIFKEEKKKIYEAFNLFHSSKDKLCFLEYIKAHLTMDFLRLTPPDQLELQYIAPDLNYNKNYSNFIDCGGYDGDTVKNILDHKYKIDNLMIFEPHSLLFLKLVDFIKKHMEYFKSAVALPCGVYSKTRTLPFDLVSDAASTGRLDQAASNMIQCVKLDESAYGFKPTFIKMDIEGAEFEALRGAKQIIRRYTPQLAICVYHCLSHIWDIPLLLNNLNLNYRFHLRSYNKMTMETVLYAFPKK